MLPDLKSVVAEHSIAHIRCDFCGADNGDQCVTRSGFGRQHPHDVRMTAAFLALTAAKAE